MNTKLKIILGVVVFCLISVYIISLFRDKRTVQAAVDPLVVILGHPINFRDSTINAKSWKWEFGNGDTSEYQWGRYFFPHVGRYQVRLTVDDKKEQRFIVEVKAPVKLRQNDSLVSVVAPSEGIQGEYIVFKGEGNSKAWRWMFGETGITDSRDQIAIYAYQQPGTYTVSLTTEMTQYPIKHIITILPKYMQTDTTDVLALIGSDIREKLQAIAGGKPFNTNYNYIMSKYLCNNSRTPVSVNNVKLNDFYSYCQGLRMLGKNTLVEHVIVMQDTANKSCVNKLIVSQLQKE